MFVVAKVCLLPFCLCFRCTVYCLLDCVCVARFIVCLFTVTSFSAGWEVGVYCLLVCGRIGFIVCLYVWGAKFIACLSVFEVTGLLSASLCGERLTACLSAYVVHGLLSACVWGAYLTRGAWFTAWFYRPRVTICP
jgi:hypothetical protein